MITIIGIGQTLRGDDGAGIQAVRRWQEAYPATATLPQIRLALEELPGLSLLDRLVGVTAAILVDAVHSGSTPGQLHSLEISDLDAFRPESDSAHGWGVAETLYLGRLLYPSELPEKIILIGIEAGGMSLGDGLSQAVGDALEQAAGMIEAITRDLLTGSV
jgi:hydrogenase maturation protease